MNSKFEKEYSNKNYLKQDSNIIKSVQSTYHTTENV